MHPLFAKTADSKIIMIKVKKLEQLQNTPVKHMRGGGQGFASKRLVSLGVGS